MQLHILKKWFDGIKQKMSEELRMAWNGVGVSLIAMSLWMATEDLDAPQMVACLYFLIIGLMAVLQKEALTGHAEHV
jgi:hypothetical protein